MREILFPYFEIEDKLMKPLPAFEMPTPFSVVLWRPVPGLASSPALVTQVNKAVISVVVFSVDARQGQPKDGVRYIDDPSVASISPDEGGIWEYTADQVLLRAVLGLDGASKGK